jgi:hypothetical protein
MFAMANRDIRVRARTYDLYRRDALLCVVYDLHPLLMTGARGALNCVKIMRLTGGSARNMSTVQWNL